MVLYIISQVLAFTGTAIDVVSKAMKNKKWVLILSVLGSIFFVSSYICLKTPLAAIVNAVHLFRSLCYVFLGEKNKPFKYYLAPMLASILITVISLIIFWSSPLDIFMLMSALILSIGVAFKNMLVVRLSLMTNSIMWCAYNFAIKGYVNLTCNVINIVILIVAIITYHVILPKKQKKETLETKTEEHTKSE